MLDFCQRSAVTTSNERWAAESHSIPEGTRQAPPSRRFDPRSQEARLFQSWVDAHSAIYGEALRYDQQTQIESVRCSAWSATTSPRTCNPWKGQSGIAATLALPQIVSALKRAMESSILITPELLVRILHEMQKNFDVFALDLDALSKDDQIEFLRMVRTMQPKMAVLSEDEQKTYLNHQVIEHAG